MNQGREEEAAGALVQLADVSRRLGQIEQSAQYHEQAAGIFEKLKKYVATLTSLKSVLNIYKKSDIDEKVSRLKERIKRIEAKQQSMKIEKKAIQKAIKETNESFKKGAITKEHSEKIQESLKIFLKEIDKKNRRVHSS